jgi:HEAT repeat protein
LNHTIWEAYFTARALVEEEGVSSLLLEHLHDGAWSLLLDFYVGLGNATPLVKALLQESLTPAGIPALLRVARWAIIAPEEVAWRNVVLKVLAQFFVRPTISDDHRLLIGRAMALVAGENARPFYLQTLRTPIPSVQAAAIRGLGWTGVTQDMKIMAAALNDKNPEVQKSAVQALADLGTAGAYRFLSDSLPRSDERLMLTIAEALADNPSGWEALKEAVKAPDLLVRRAAVHGMGRIPEPWTIEILQHMAREDNQWLVRSAADAAMSLHTQEKAVAVVPAPPKIDEIQWLIAWAAKQGLGLGVGEAALQMLLRALEVGDTETKVLPSAR